VKAVLALLGHGKDHLRLPMVPVTAATQRKLEQLLIELGLLVN
jgi:dihydrodipicolinate synthase/N-acetylneuraminate lyase